jgi:hypothetical protein
MLVGKLVELVGILAELVGHNQHILFFLEERLIVLALPSGKKVF